MKFYFSPGACSFATHIALNEVGAKYEAVKIDFKNKPADFVKLNPKGYVPALMTDKNEFLTEGAVILQYVADQFPDKNLIPKFGTFERYRAMEMLNFIATEIHKGCFSPLFGADRFVQNAEGNAQLKEALKANLSKKFAYMEEKLKQNTFLLGNQFTVCDAYFYTVTSWAKHVNVDMSKYPKIMGFMEKTQARPSVQAAAKFEG